MIESLLTFLTETRDPMAPAQMSAGWLFGISNQEQEMRDAIVACYKVNDDLTNDYFEGMAAYESGDIHTGEKRFSDAEHHYDDAFGGCSREVTDALTSWKDKVDKMMAMDDWDKISAKIYADNKDVLDQDIQFEFKTWDEGVYFDAGMFAGRYEKVFLDNIPKSVEFGGDCDQADPTVVEFGAACRMQELCGTNCESGACLWTWPIGTSMDDPATACACQTCNPTF